MRIEALCGSMLASQRKEDEWSRSLSGLHWCCTQHQHSIKRQSQNGGGMWPVSEVQSNCIDKGHKTVSHAIRVRYRANGIRQVSARWFSMWSDQELVYQKGCDCRSRTTLTLHLRTSIEALITYPSQTSIVRPLRKALASCRLPQHFPIDYY